MNIRADRRIFEWLQEGDERQTGDYSVSSLTGWMRRIIDSEVGTKVKQGDMPVFRPINLESFKPLTERDTFLSHSPNELKYQQVT